MGFLRQEYWSSVRFPSPVIPFSFSPCYLPEAKLWGSIEDNGDLLQKAHAFTATLSAPKPAAGHCQPTPARDSWTLMGESGSISCGVSAPFSWVLVCTSLFLCPPRVYFPVPCKFWQLYVGLMSTSSKRAYATPRFAAPWAPILAAGHCWAIPPQELLPVLSQSLWGLWVLVHTRVVWALWASLVGMGFDSKCDFTPPTILLGLLCPWLWGISSWLLQHSTAAAPVHCIKFYISSDDSLMYSHSTYLYTCTCICLFFLPAYR